MGNSARIKIASSALLFALLFSPKTDVNKYEELQSSKKFCDIPIAVVEEMPDLGCIKAQKMGTHTVKCGNDTVYLTELSGSSIVDNKNLLWTVRPLISLPCDANPERMEYCGIVQTPSVNDVLANLINLSTTAFAHHSRFERHNPGSSGDLSILLPMVVVSMLKFIQEKLNKQQWEYICKEHNLKHIAFLPVQLPNNVSEEYALVKPIQVLYTMHSFFQPSTSQKSLLDSFYPFLHPLIQEAFGVIEFLLHIGVQSSISFSHIQLILELAKFKCQDNEVDVNIKHIILKATDELIKLLQNNDGKENAVQCLKPLYLLSQDNKLVECSKLIVFDVVGLYKLTQFPLSNGYAFMHPMKDDHQVRSKLLLELLPKELGLKSLKFMLNYDIIDSIQSEEVFPNVSIIGEILLSKEFKLGIELLARCNSTDGSVPASVTNIVETFQKNLTIQNLDSLTIKPIIKIDDDIIPFANTIDHWNFLLQKSTGQKWTLSLKNVSNAYSSSIFTKLAKQFCRRLKLNKLSCFDSSNGDDILELHEFISQMLQSQSISKLVEVIHSNIPEYFTDDLDLPSQFINDSVDPELGGAIAEHWHFRLDQDIFNLFRPEEWVGYEMRNGDIVYARILHEIELNSTTHVLINMQKMMQRKFLIDIGNDEPVEAHVLELYKFIQNSEESFQDNVTWL